MAKYINFSKIDSQKYFDALAQILNLPITKRSDYDSIEAIEAEIEVAKTKNLKVLRLQNRDYEFLKGQTDYALEHRNLQNPKAWKPFIDALDNATADRPEEYPIT